MRVDVLLDVRSELAEGPRWDAAAGVLLWVDIEGRTLHRWDGTTHEATVFDDRLGCVAPTDAGDMLVALATRLVLASTGAELARFPHGADTRTNDGACDPDGRFWIGTTALDFHDGGGALYRYDGGGLRSVIGGLGLANGIGWSRSGGRMYFVDSNAQRIWSFDYDGEPGLRRVFARIRPDDGTPDGLTIDDEGCVWLALYGGGAVRRYAPDGTLEGVLALPAENVTSCCFGGDDGRTLFVTTAAPDGRVYVADVGVAGPAAVPFRSTAPSDAEPTSSR